MRIVHFIIGRCNPDSANGLDKTIYYLSKTQAMLGHDVSMYSLTLKPAIPIPNVQVKTFPPGKFRFVMPLALLRDIKRDQPDVVHLHSVYAPRNAILAWWLRYHNIPYVMTPNGGLSEYILQKRWYLKRPYQYLIERPLHNRAAFVHAVADKDAIRNYGVRAPIVEAPNGIDLSEVPCLTTSSLLHERFPQIQGKKIFLFLGRLEPWQKNLYALLEGFADTALDDAILILAGPDDRTGSRQKLERQIQDFGIAQQVIFTGAIYGQEKWEFLASADVFVHPSRWEAGVPFSLLEAASVQKPCLVSPGADPQNLFTQYDAGISVQPDAKNIAEGLLTFNRMSPSELKLMGVNARRLVEDRFDWVKIAQTLIEGYRTYA